MNEFEMHELDYKPRVKNPVAYMRAARQKYETLRLLDAHGVDMDEVLKDEKNGLEYYSQQFKDLDPIEQRRVYKEVIKMSEDTSREILPDKESLTVDDIYEYRLMIYSYLSTGIRIYDDPDVREIENMENFVRAQVDYAIDKIGGPEEYSKCAATGKWKPYEDAKKEFRDKFMAEQNNCFAMYNNLS